MNEGCYTLIVERSEFADIGGWWPKVKLPDGRIIKPKDVLFDSHNNTLSKRAGFRLARRVSKVHKKQGFLTDQSRSRQRTEKTYCP